jgi:alpha-tubulin suppressor-like RCC1 family protein
MRQLLVVGVLAGSGVASRAAPVDRAPSAVHGAVSIVDVGAGGYTGYAVLSDGRVRAWGDNLEGQVGVAGPSRTVPVEVSGLSGAIAVAGGGNSGFALRRDGTLWAWGDDSGGELADERFTARSTAARIRSLGSVIAVSAGAFAAYAIKRDGTAWSWGDNSFGQLGTGSDLAVSTMPGELRGLRNVRAVAAGSADGYALLRNGTVWAFGDNTLGQLGGARCGAELSGGRAPCRSSTLPRRVRGLTGVVAIAAGGDSGYALRRDGTVWAWGDDEFGELGDGEVRLDRQTPVQVAGLHDVIAIAAGSCSGYALLRGGTVWSWGQGTYGQLGDGGTTNHDLPVRVQGLTDVEQLVGGGDMAFALQRSGTLWAWGDDEYGQLGDGSVVSRTLPAPVLDLPGSPGRT